MGCGTILAFYLIPGAQVVPIAVAGIIILMFGSTCINHNGDGPDPHIEEEMK